MTLDPAVAAQIERVGTSRGLPFNQVLNDALGIGLRELSRTPGEHPFISPTMPRDLGQPLIDVRDTSAAITETEGDPLR